jgi:hypothetical protein
MVAAGAGLEERDEVDGRGALHKVGAARARGGVGRAGGGRGGAGAEGAAGQAAAGGDCEAVRMLLDAGAEVDARARGGQTALLIAVGARAPAAAAAPAASARDAGAARGRAGVAEVEAAALLLARGADARAADARGWGAAHHAAAAGAREQELVALLRGAGALELAARDRAGRSAVQAQPALRPPPAHTCTLKSNQINAPPALVRPALALVLAARRARRVTGAGRARAGR